LDLKKVKDSVSIVLVGSFNTKIFHPSWFAANKLIPNAEEEEAKIRIITEDVASFDLKWLHLTVLRDRFSAITDDESSFALSRDLVFGVFCLLEHTPIKQLGLNRTICFKMESEEKWHCVGHSLAPKGLWNKYLVKPGMKFISIEGKRSDGRDGVINVTAKPIPGARDMVEVAVNSHFELGDKASGLDAVRIIEDKWDSSLSTASEIAHGIIQDCLEEDK
jgi:hypothetical protein